jgi:hypothetical protein
MMRLVHYPWRISLSRDDALTGEDLPVASGASLVVNSGDTSANLHLPKRTICINDVGLSVFEIPDTDSGGHLRPRTYLPEHFMASSGAFNRPDPHYSSGETSAMNAFVEAHLRLVQFLEDTFRSVSSNLQSAIRRMDWNKLLDAYNGHKEHDRLIRKPLIITLAEQQTNHLAHIARGPKKILRRERGSERLSRAREFDKACLIRLAQTPGRSVIEKAGPKQRIQAVKRIESTDVLENRVVADFCLRCRDEWQKTDSLVGDRLNSDWRELGESYDRLCRKIGHADEFRNLPKLKIPARQPNHTLTQNLHYRSVWSGYQQLLKLEQEREDCWMWARRLFLNRALLQIAEIFETAFPAKDAAFIPYNKCARFRPVQEFGLWLDDGSLPGPRVVEHKGQPTTVYCLSAADVIAGLGCASSLLTLNADVYLLAASADKIIVCPVFAFVGNNQSDAAARAAQDLEDCLRKLIPSIQGGEIRIEIPQALFIWAKLPDREPPNPVGGYVLTAGLTTNPEDAGLPEEDWIGILHSYLLP